MGLDNDQLWAINDLVTATTIFSFFGSLFIITSLVYFTHAHRIAEVLKKCGIDVDWKPNERVNLEKLAFRLVFNVAISDMCYEISFWFTTPNTHGESTKCEFSGWLQQFGTLSSVMWVTCITYVIHNVVSQPDRYQSIADDMWKFHAIIWGTSFTTSFFPMFSSSYGQAGGWCWIDSSDWGIFWRFLVFYCPVWGIIGYILYIFYQSYKSLGLENRILKQMRLYPAILIVTWTFGTINRIVQAAGKDVFGLACIHAFLMSLYGFFNALAYLYTPVVRETVLPCWYGAEMNNAMVPIDKSGGPKADEPAYDLEPIISNPNQPSGVQMSSGTFEESSDSMGAANTSSFMDTNVDIGVSDVHPSESFNVVYAKSGSSEEFKGNNSAADGTAIEVQATYELEKGAP